MNVTFGFTDFVLVLGSSQGIFLGIMLQIIQNKNKIANKILSLLLAAASIMLIGRFLYSFDSNNEFFFRIALFLDTIIFLVGPLLYMYCKRLIFHNNDLSNKHYYYFLPFGVMCIYYLWTLTHSHEQLLTLFQKGKPFIPFLIIETSGLLFNFYFCYRCYRLMKRYKMEEKKNLSYSQNIIPFLKIIVIITITFFTLWLISYTSFYFFKTNMPYINYRTTWIAFPVFIYIIGFYSLKQPEFFRLPAVRNEKQTGRERLEGETLIKLKENLEMLMEEKKIYLQPKLTLIELAQKLDTSPNNLSWLLNNIHGSSFYNYINRYRLQAFIEKIKKGEHHSKTLLALALESGFNSKSTFNKAFRSELNDTPRNYIKKITKI